MFLNFSINTRLRISFLPVFHFLHCRLLYFTQFQGNRVNNPVYFFVRAWCCLVRKFFWRWISFDWALMSELDSFLEALDTVDGGRWKSKEGLIPCGWSTGSQGLVRSLDPTLAIFIFRTREYWSVIMLEIKISEEKVPSKVWFLSPQKCLPNNREEVNFYLTRAH